MPSPLLEFYLGRSAAGIGWIGDIVGCWSDDDWETNHDFIQWLFPLKTPSAFNPDAPRLTDSDIQEFRRNRLLQDQLQRSFERFLTFVGLAAGVQIVKGGDFDRKRSVWQHPNHNWLRMTRVLASLNLLGADSAARALFNCLDELGREGFGSPESFGYWQRASKGFIE